MGKYIIPFKERNKSSIENRNFLYKEKNIYIMDNHRAALWCWLQHIKEEVKYSIFHIDQHYDTGPYDKKLLNEIAPKLIQLSIDEYLELDYESNGYRHKWVQYGNYLSIFLDIFNDNIDKIIFATANEGSKPQQTIDEKRNFDVLENLDYWLENNKNWIFNLDLDYFFVKNYNQNFKRFLSDDFIITLGGIIKNNLDNKRIEVLTIALSPEFCGGWAESERVLDILNKELNIHFNLPEK